MDWNYEDNNMCCEILLKLNNILVYYIDGYLKCWIGKRLNQESVEQKIIQHPDLSEKHYRFVVFN